MTTLTQCDSSNLSELYLSLRPNNQITVGLQNCKSTKRDIYQNREAFFLSSSDIAKQKTVDALRSDRVDSYKKFGSESRQKAIDRARLNKALPFKYVQKIHPLDIILKSQRALQPMRTACFIFAFSAAVARCLRFYSCVSMSSPKKFTYKAGQKIRECGAVVDHLCKGNPAHARVITLTLPASTLDSYEVLAAYSGYVVNRLFQKVRRDVPDCNMWFFVWEHQKRGALHLHICLYHENVEVAKSLGDSLVELWIEILKDISIKSGVSMFYNPHQKRDMPPSTYQNLNQEMRKSCGGYFSKYASKSSKNEQNEYVHKMAQKYPPSRFWGSSQSIKDLIKENSFSFSNTYKNEIEARKEYDFLIELLLELEIVQYSEYSFCKDIDLVDCNGFASKLRVSEGFRQTFYLSESDYKSVLSKMNWMFNEF